MQGVAISRRRLLQASAITATAAATGAFGALADGAHREPVGFRLPLDCKFVGEPTQNGTYLQWQVDCGPAHNRAARGHLGEAAARQGWTLCMFGMARAVWVRDVYALVVFESSGAPGNYVKLTQRPRGTGECR